METDEMLGQIKSDLEEFKEFVGTQFQHGREHFQDIETKLDDHIRDENEKHEKVQDRLSLLEQAKIYADGFKSGAVWAIGFGIASIVGAAVWIISKIMPSGG
jgi:hypothetical protein